MSTDALTRIEQLRGHKFSEVEAARLREIGDTLDLRDDDAVWNILAALEYQRTYYEALPAKIAKASKDVLQGITVAAEKETAAAQAKLTDSVVQQAKRLATKINYATLLPMCIAALVCVLLFGSLTMWAGYCMGAKQSFGVVQLLRMPSGFLMAGLCFAGGIPLFMLGGMECSAKKKGWWKKMVAALVMLTAGSAIFPNAL